MWNHTCCVVYVHTFIPCFASTLYHLIPVSPRSSINIAFLLSFFPVLIFFLFIFISFFPFPFISVFIGILFSVTHFYDIWFIIYCKKRLQNRLPDLLLLKIYKWNFFLKKKIKWCFRFLSEKDVFYSYMQLISIYNFNQKNLIYPSPITYTLRACFVMNADLANLAWQVDK